jgi:hypothetical protein
MTNEGILSILFSKRAERSDTTILGTLGTLGNLAHFSCSGLFGLGSYISEAISIVHITKFQITIPGYLERTSVLDFVEAAPTGVFFSNLGLPDKRITIFNDQNIEVFMSF